MYHFLARRHNIYCNVVTLIVDHLVAGSKMPRGFRTAGCSLLMQDMSPSANVKMNERLVNSLLKMILWNKRVSHASHFHHNDFTRAPLLRTLNSSCNIVSQLFGAISKDNTGIGFTVVIMSCICMWLIWWVLVHHDSKCFYSWQPSSFITEGFCCWWSWHTARTAFVKLEGR